MMSGTHNLNETTSYDPEQVPSGSKASLNKKEEPASLLKKKSLYQGFKETYFEYCSNTSIHGVQYLVEERSWKEIIFWICIFLVSLGFCGDAITKVYKKWDETPVIVSFSERSTDIWKVPFPAVTICLGAKRSHRTGPSFDELFVDFNENRQSFQPNISSSELEEFLTLLQICKPEDVVKNENEKYPSSYPPIDYIRILNEMSPREYFSTCTWYRSTINKCDKLFTKSYTEEGICYTFNGLNAADLYRETTVQHQMDLETENRTLSWSLEKGYAPDTPLLTYPARVLSSGSRAALQVNVNMLTADLDFGCREDAQNLKLLLHSPDDVPVVSNQFVLIDLGKETLITVKPNMMTTSDGVANHPPEKRLCYLPGERHLRFFKIYSENNCELECLANFTLSECHCVKFSMPRTHNMTLCADDKIHCCEDAEARLLVKDYSGNFQNSNNLCNCLPACTSLQYDAEISQGNYDRKSMLKTFNFKSTNIDDREWAIIKISFKDKEFFTSKRSELYNSYDFLANCGGILGLFMGFSLLSVVEILYHFTLRLWANMRRTNDVN